MRQHVPPQQLWNEFHGDMEFEYDHSVYWPALLKLAEERYSERRERWIKAGKHYGESEIYLRGGDAPSLFQSRGVEVAPAPEKEKEVTVPVRNDSATEESKAPIQTNGTQSNGNMDIMAVTTDPILTTEGDRS
jgi:hypothetical protein